MKRLNWGWSITMVLALLVGCSGAEEKQKVPIPSNKMVEAPQNSATTSTEKNGVDGESPPNGPGAEVPALPNSPGGSAASVPDHNDATGAAPGGGRPLGSDPQKFTRDLPGGHEQQLPDRALGGLDPLTPNEAMEKGIGSLKRRDAQLGEPVVILAGMGPHGVPIVAESTDPADLDPDTPALIIDGTTRDPATTYADCLGLLQVCAERTTTMDGCVDAVSTCKTFPKTFPNKSRIISIYIPDSD